MALFHLSVTQVQRSAGQSAIASDAYRAGERLYSEYYAKYKPTREDLMKLYQVKSAMDAARCQREQASRRDRDMER